MPDVNVPPPLVVPAVLGEALTATVKVTGLATGLAVKLATRLRFAVTVKDAGGRLVDIVEQPTAADLARAAGQGGRVGVSMNIWRFPYDWILPCLEGISVHPDRKERELPAAVSLLLRRRPGCMDALPAADAAPAGWRCRSAAAPGRR